MSIPKVLAVHVFSLVSNHGLRAITHEGMKMFWITKALGVNHQNGVVSFTNKEHSESHPLILLTMKMGRTRIAAVPRVVLEEMVNLSRERKTLEASNPRRYQITKDFMHK